MLRDPLTGVPAGLLIIVALVKFCKPVPIKHQKFCSCCALSNQNIVHMILLKKNSFHCSYKLNMFYHLKPGACQVNEIVLI